MKCILCKNEAELIKKDFSGLIYIGVDGKKEDVPTDRFYDIYHCNYCDTRFVSPCRDIDYEKVYTQTNIYDGLLEFAERIKHDSDPWWILIGRGQQYYVGLDFIKGKKGLYGFDVGCGYGYFTAAVNGLGHYIKGLEVSDYVIENANRIFGDGFIKADIRNVKTDVEVDVIFGLEVIEHLSKPLEFMKACKELVKNGGSIVLSTPNLDYFRVRKMESGAPMLSMGWVAEMPPVHLALYSKKSMEWLAKELEMDLRFTDFPGGLEQTIGAIFTK